MHDLSDNKNHIYEVHALANKEVIEKTTFFHKISKFKGGNSDNFCARVVNLVTFDVVYYQKHIFESEILTSIKSIKQPNFSREVEKKKTCIISRLPSTYISSFIKIFSVIFALSRNPVLWTDGLW
jgi:hypothetical protein